MNFSNMALFVVYPPRRPPETGAVSVFVSLMESMAASTSRFLDDVLAEADFESLSLRNKEDTDDDDNTLEGVFFDKEEEDYSDYGDHEDSDDDDDHDLPAPPA